MAAATKTTYHAHGCATCGERMEDNCDTPKVDGQCITCRGGRETMLLIENRQPKGCCREKSRLASKEERTQYRLAGAKTWYICAGPGGCYRTHPYNPKMPR